MAFKDWEFYFLSVIKGHRRGVDAAILRFVLRIFSVPFRLSVRFRNWMFDHGWLKSYMPPVPLVISVGNITAGGTGKTPVTLMLAEELHNHALLAILARGYRSQAEKFSAPVLLHKNRGILHPASLCGDESFLLADNLPNAYVIVGRNRYQSSKLAARMGAEVILLDDGMQHRGIARDLEVVVMDLQDPFGQGYFLPRGLLREGKEALARADLIILNHAYDKQKIDHVKRQISPVTSAPIVCTQVEVSGVFDLKDAPIPFKESTVGIFCGIAHPDYFRSTVLKNGSAIIGELFFPDHDTFNHEELLSFAEHCKEKGASLLLCTEKDRVKLSDTNSFSLPIGYVKTRLKVVEGDHHWKEFVDHAKTTLKAKI